MRWQSEQREPRPWGLSCFSESVPLFDFTLKRWRTRVSELRQLLIRRRGVFIGDAIQVNGFGRPHGARGFIPLFLRISPPLVALWSTSRWSSTNVVETASELETHAFPMSQLRLRAYATFQGESQTSHRWSRV